MNYAQAVEYLDGFVNIERSLQTRTTRAVITLDRVNEIARRLGHLERHFHTLHVAGTKGKGSTCAFLSSILSAAGLKVGLYVSPHLQDFRERISINGIPIPQDDFARVLTACAPVLDTMRQPPKGERRPTYFEILTHLAFAWFAEQQVDAAVIEVGLGGRLDATNIITPQVCGITHISYDHTAILGETLELIAREKAGIMKSGVPVVIASQMPEAEAALVESAQNIQAPFERVGHELILTIPNNSICATGLGCGPSALSTSAAVGDWPFPQAKLTLSDGRFFEATLGLRGEFQTQNWAVAVRMADLFLQKTGKANGKGGGLLLQRAVCEGSRLVSWPGRMEVIFTDKGGAVVLDGAHNGHSVSVVLKEVLTHTPSEKVAVLFACAKDKDATAMLRELASVNLAGIVFATSGSARSREPQDLATAWRTITGREGGVEGSLPSAYENARQLAGVGGTVLAIGSLYLVGAIKDMLQNSVK